MSMTVLGTKRKRRAPPSPPAVPPAPAAAAPVPEVVRCICSAITDDGFEMIECEGCKVWQHTECVGAPPGSAHAWRCERCDPRPPAELAQQTAAARARKGVDVAPDDEYVRIPGAGTYDVRRLGDGAGIRYGVFCVGPVGAGAGLGAYAGQARAVGAYLADPTNQYARLRMPKPFVHVLPAQGVVLDARAAGNPARFVRSACAPAANARIEVEEEGGFVLVATRAMEKDDEVLLPWEWDDEHPVRRLANATGPIS